MRFHLVMRRDSSARIFRVGRLLWGSEPTTGGNTRKLSVAVQPLVFDYDRTHDDWRLTLLGVRLHYERSDFGVLV